MFSWAARAGNRAGWSQISAAGKFAAKRTPAFDADAACEDMGAVFFDFEGDGDLDLFVVSGGNECEPGDPSLQDRLYLNDGTGAFAPAGAGTVPPETDSGSAVAATDSTATATSTSSSGDGRCRGSIRSPPPATC